MIFPLPLPACQLCVSQLCASSFCGCFRWPLVAIRGSPNSLSIACRLFPFLSLFGVSIVGTVFVDVSVFLTGSVASTTARFCSIYVHWLSALSSSLSIFPFFRQPLYHFVCLFARSVHPPTPTTVRFGRHCLAFYPSIDGPVWLVSCRPPVLITVLAEVRHLAALGHWLFVHSGHLCRHLCWLDIIWRHALILVRFVPLSRSRFGCCPTTPISGHYGQSPLLFYRFPLFGLCSADSDSDSGQCLRGCVCPVLSNRWFSSYCCRSSRFSAIPDVPDVVPTVVFSTAFSGRCRCSGRCQSVCSAVCRLSMGTDSLSVVRLPVHSGCCSGRPVPSSP